MGTNWYGYDYTIPNKSEVQVKKREDCGNFHRVSPSTLLEINSMAFFIAYS